MLMLLARLRPGEGWGNFFLTLATILCLPSSFVAGKWVPGDEGVLTLTVVAFLVGRWLALRREWGREVWLPVGASLGILTALSVAAHTALFLPSSGTAILDFAQRWMTWLQVAFRGGTSEDTDIFLFYASLLCWSGILLATWALYSRHRPLLALSPLILLTALSPFYSEQGIGWLVAELSLGVLVLASGNLARAERRWNEKDVDYAVDLYVSLIGPAAFVAVAVAVLGYFGPLLSVDNVSDWVRHVFEGPSEQVDETAERLFGGVSPVRRGAAYGGVQGAGVGSYLPQDRLLGGQPGSQDNIVMTVWTDEAPPPMLDHFARYEYEDVAVPPHYWRGMAYDYYTGRGWAVTADARETLEGSLPLPAPPDYYTVTQRYRFTAPHGDTLYVLNAPVWVESSIETLWYTPPSLSDEAEGDLAAEEDVANLAGLLSEVMTYTVVSDVPRPTATDLRTAWDTASGIDLTETLTRYLQLPDTVPQRVIDLAWEVAVQGETPYDKARLLESYLRRYPYSLEVDTPPKDRDVADYFLFEAREGYCDYYATAFVVMARAVGIPARLASGYVGGEYDYLNNVYVVRQFNGHSWPEVYFPGWGWIGFEPTGSQPVTELPEDVLLGQAGLPGPTGPPARVVRARWRATGLRLLGFAAACLVAFWIIRRRRRSEQPITVPAVWARVGQAGSRLGLPPDSALTPQEYAMALSAELHARTERTCWSRERWKALAKQGGEALRLLAASYSLQTYAGPLVVPPDERELRRAWLDLHRALHWFRWLGRVQRVVQL